MNHTRILAAYLSRLSFRDIEAIAEANRRCWYAQLNNGTNEQIRQQNNLVGAIDNAVCRLISHDLDLIEQIISEEVV